MISVGLTLETKSSETAVTAEVDVIVILFVPASIGFAEVIEIEGVRDELTRYVFVCGVQYPIKLKVNNVWF